MKLPIVHGNRTDGRVKFCCELTKKGAYRNHLLISHSNSCYNWQGIYKKCSMKECEYCISTPTSVLATDEAAAPVRYNSYTKSNKKFNVEAGVKFCTKCNSHHCHSQNKLYKLPYSNKSIKKQSQKQKQYALNEIMDLYIE